MRLDQQGEKYYRGACTTLEAKLCCGFQDCEDLSIAEQETPTMEIPGRTNFQSKIVNNYITIIQ